MIIRSRAPLRIGFAGGGTDLSPFSDDYGGVVLNGTICQYNSCTLEELDSKQGIEFLSTDLDERVHYNLAPELPFDGRLDLLCGVYNRIVREFNCGDPIPIRITTYSDVPMGSGLGSSSTMVVAIIKAFVEYLNLPLGEYDVAHLAYEIERLEVKLAGGKQDQYAATFGGFNFIEFYAEDRVIVNPLRVKNWIVSELEASLILFYTGQSRASGDIIQSQIANMQARDSSSIEALVDIKEQSYRMKEALLKGNVPAFSEVMNQGWAAKKQLAAQITNSAIDQAYLIAMENGASAGKISGAGGGGFLTLIVDPPKRAQVLNALAGLPGQVMPCHFTNIGTQSWRLP